MLYLHIQTIKSMKKVLASLLPLLSFYFVSAQSFPGGVSSNLQMWVKSNSGTSTSGSLLDSWTYVNNGSNSYTSTSGDRPSLISNVINFNPSVRFSGGVHFMNGPIGSSTPITIGDDDYTIFAVWLSNSTTAFQRIFSQRSACYTCNDAFSVATWDGTAPGPGVYGVETATSPFSHTIQRSYVASAWNISQLNLLNTATSDLEVIDDRNINTGGTAYNTDPGGTPNGPALRSLSNVVNRIGASFETPTASGPLDGDIAELIIFDRPISGAERNSVFSYLAMKYGVTLKTDLIASSGTTVWNATTNSTYNNSVFGLGRDNAASGSDLSISQSNSIETGSGDGTGQSGKGNIVLSSPSSLDNLDFLQVGNDNAALTEITTDLPASAVGSKRFTREWKVQHTGNVGTVSFSFDFTGLTTTGVIGNTGDFRLMIDEDGNGNFSNGTIRYYSPVSFTGNVANFTGVTLNNNEVFAIITKPNSFLLPVTWKDFSVALVNKDARLNWSIDNNADADVYEIEHSADGITFEKIGTSINKTDIKSYSFIHKGLLGGTHFYRIRQVDLNGRGTYSRIISVNVKSNDFVVSLVNNPVQKNYAEVIVNATLPAKASVELWSLNGSKTYTQVQPLNAGSNNIRIAMDKAAPGNYLLKVTVNGVPQSLQFVKL
jgi:hypothetical protein